RVLTKDSIGPVILAACEATQVALENENIDFAGTACGLFTVAMRKTMDEKEEFASADLDKNQILTAKEIAFSIKKLIPQYVDQLPKLGVTTIKGEKLGNQDPVYFLPPFEENLELAHK